MKKAYGIAALFTLLFFLLTGPALAQLETGCTRASDEATRVETAQALLKVNTTDYHYDTVINYWADDVTYSDPLFVIQGRVELYDYLQAMYRGTIYGFPTDKTLEIRDELYETHGDGSMTYIATVQWDGTHDIDGSDYYYFQTGMSIIEFEPGEGCPSYHKDYYSEGDVWYNIPGTHHDTIVQFRGMYINMFELTGRCFDEDGDGYTKYAEATGCANPGLDCDDFNADINPEATEISGNGIDEDCDPEAGD